MLPYNEPGPSTTTAYPQYPPTQHTTGHRAKPLSTAYAAQQHTNFGRAKPIGSALRAEAESHYLQQQQPRGYLPQSSHQSHYSKRAQPQMHSSDMHQRRLDAMHSMRKHRSLDGSLFLSDYDNQPPQSRIPPPPLYGGSDPHDPAFSLPHTSYDLKYGASYDPQLHQRAGMYGQTGGQNYPMGYDDIPLPAQSSSKLPAGMNAYGDDLESLRQENMALNQKLNYMMNSIRSFWSPELKNERQQRKDESVRLAAFQDKVMQQASEIQTIRNELDRREKDIGQLLSDSDLLDMEDELRRLRKHLTPNAAHDQLHHQRSSTSSQPPQPLHQPRDYTEKNLSAHEIHTLKMKMERSELSLAEKQRELQNAELRLKGAEEQNNELEKRLEIVTRSNVANEAQLKLLQDDLNILRSKLETRNQLVEGKEKTIKILEKDVDLLRQQLQESGQGIHNQDHRNAQLQIRVDQLETLLRERESEVDRLKQRLHQQPSTRIEQELQQRIENLETDNRKLLETVDAVRKGGDVEKQQQLQAFQDETRQLQSTIQNLQKELADRQILLASQNEKISQFDSQLKSAAELGGGGVQLGAVRPSVSVQTASPTVMTTSSEKAKRAEHSTELLQKELEETRNEVGHLLQKIQSLEREKITLQNKCSAAGYDRSGVPLDSKAESSSSAAHRTKGESSALKMRIEELEEALRESVGITAEREKQLNEQKLIIQQMSAQVADLYKDPTRRLKGTGKTDAEQKAWDEERQRYQRQLVNLRKEVTMAAIREKDACIQLLQGPPDSLKEKVDILARQKEQLRHRLLTQNSESYSTTESGPYLGNVWLAAQQPTSLELTNPAHLALNAPKTFGKTISGGQPLHRVQPPFSNYVHSGTGLIQNGIMAGAPTSQVTISIPPYGSAPSAPASFTYGTKIDATDDGIWA